VTDDENIPHCRVCILLQDFDTDPELKAAVRELLEEMVNNSCLLPAEHKAASSILCVLIKDAEVALKTKVNLEILLAPPEVFLHVSLLLSLFVYYRLHLSIPPPSTYSL